MCGWLWWAVGEEALAVRRGSQGCWGAGPQGCVQPRMRRQHTHLCAHRVRVCVPRVPCPALPCPPHACVCARRRCWAWPPAPTRSMLRGRCRWTCASPTRRARWWGGGCGVGGRAGCVCVYMCIHMCVLLEGGAVDSSSSRAWHGEGVWGGGMCCPSGGWGAVSSPQVAVAPPPHTPSPLSPPLPPSPPPRWAAINRHPSSLPTPSRGVRGRRRRQRRRRRRRRVKARRLRQSGLEVGGESGSQGGRGGGWRASLRTRLSHGARACVHVHAQACARWHVWTPPCLSLRHEWCAGRLRVVVWVGGWC